MPTILSNFIIIFHSISCICYYASIAAITFNAKIIKPNIASRNNLMRIPGMRRPLAILIVYIGLITLILDFAFLIGPTIDQIRDLAGELTNIGGSVTSVIGAVDSFLIDRGLNASLVERVEVENLAANVQTWLEDNAIPILQTVASAFVSTGLVLAISFYIVLDGGRRLDEALKVLPLRAEHETRFVLGTIDQTFHGYVRGMLVVSLIYGVGTASVMFATDLPAALPTAIISSVLLAVPFVGDWLALTLPLVIAFVAGDFITFLVVLSVLLFIQQGYDGVCGGGIKFGGVSTLQLEHVAGKLDGGDLHSKAKD